MRIKVGERRPESLTGRYDSRQQLRRFRFSQQRGGFFHYRQNLFAQPHFAHRGAGDTVAGSCERAPQAVRAGDRNVIDLG